MKHLIMGFSQQRAVELGLDMDDLVVLDWFLDNITHHNLEFAKMFIDGKNYYWVDYSEVLNELPILNISKQTLYKRIFTKLVKTGCLDHKQVKLGGSFSYYTIGEKLKKIIEED